MPTDDRTFITLHDGMPDHPKIEPLSDRAFRLWIETICWCSRHLTDGEVPASTWRRRGTPAGRRELVSAGLVEDFGSKVVVHDYLDHQRSARQVAERREAKRSAGIKGNHERWHVGPEGVPNPQCPLCPGEGPEPPPSGIADGSHEGSQLRPSLGSQMGSQNGRTTSRNGHRTESPEVEVEVEVEVEKELLGARSVEASPPRASFQDRQTELCGQGHSLPAHRLVEAYAKRCAYRPAAAVLSALGPQVDELLTNDWPSDLITRCLDVWGSKGLDARKFASVAHEVANAAASARRDGTDSKTAGWAAVRDELAARQTGQVIQLPGSAS